VTAGGREPERDRRGLEEDVAAGWVRNFSSLYVADKVGSLW
jgi:hypothetical protein